MPTAFTHHTHIETDSPILRAAFEVAQRAHDKQGRGKGGLPYLVHPIMLYDLLVHFGERDELTLAAALLHDAKEDCKDYLADPQLMRRELSKKMAAAGVTDAAPIAAYIDDMCTELTNDRVMFEGKRTWQVEHVGKTSLRVAKIKLFDQMASVLDNIISPDDAVEGEGGNRWSQNWSYKALDVVKAIAERSPQLDFYRDMFKVLFKYNMKILNESEQEAAALRAGFDWDLAEKEAHRLNETKVPDAEPVASVPHREVATLDKGVTLVKFGADGRVTHYASLANPHAEKDETRNSAAIELMGKLEESATNLRVTIGPTEVIDGRMVRLNKIKPPIEAAQFITIAESSAALDKSLAVEIRDKSRELAKGRGAG
ncbi:MAG: hypothetical protein ACKVOE_05135 [Rickettsiales bacterium]